MLILSITDFDNSFQTLSKSIKTNPLIQVYIDRYEKKYIYELLGEALGDLFIANLSAGSPTDPRFQTIFNPFNKQDTTNWRHKMYESLGIKDILACAIFYHYIKDSKYGVSQAGVVDSSVDTANGAGSENTQRFAEKKFNEMLDSWDAIKWYIRKNMTTYPEYIYIDTPSPKFSALL